jgi:hypothetical protein
VLQSENNEVQKNADNYGDNCITAPGSKELTKHPCSISSDNAPPGVTIMARCPGPPIAQKPLCWKNNFHLNLWSASISGF